MQTKNSVIPPFVWRLTLVACFIIVSVAGVLAGMIALRGTHATAPPDDPLVVIVVDHTNDGKPCVMQIVKYPGLPQKVTPPNATRTTRPCEPGTSMSTKMLHRSEALAQHEAFVVLPDTHASKQVKQQADSQIQQLFAQKQSFLRMHTPQQEVAPNITCGWTTETSFSPLVNGDKLNLWLQYYLHTDCNTSTLDTTTVTLQGTYYNSLYWQNALWGHIDCWIDYDPLNAWRACASVWSPRTTVAPPNHKYSLTMNKVVGLGDSSDHFFDRFGSASNSNCNNDSSCWREDFGRPN